MSLTYAIADLHGRFDLLEAAFGAISKHAHSTPNKIITLGDYIDRGPQSRQVIEHLMAAQSAGMNLICLKGNHEDIAWQTLRKPLHPSWWLGNGGGATEQQGQIVIDLLKRLVAASMSPRGVRACSDLITLETALLIEDYFAQHHVGGRVQRLAKVQCAVKRAIARAATQAAIETERVGNP